MSHNTCSGVRIDTVPTIYLWMRKTVVDKTHIHNECLFGKKKFFTIHTHKNDTLYVPFRSVGVVKNKHTIVKKVKINGKRK